MATKTRYLQLSDTTMFEYKMNGEGDPKSVLTRLFEFDLKDGHRLLLAPVSNEVEAYNDSTGKHYKNKLSPKTLNTLNNTSVPVDAKDSKWYHFNDPDYAYVNNSLMAGYDEEQVKVNEYMKYIDSSITEYAGISDLRSDSMRLYFVNGYDFGNVYGFYTRIWVEGVNGDKIDFCDFFFTRENAYKFISFVPTPIIFGNDIYDRYIEVNLPCLYDLINQKGSSAIATALDIKENTMIKMSFAMVLDSEMEISPLEYTVEQLASFRDAKTENVNLTYVRSMVLNGTVPTETVNSDRLGCYLSEVPDMPYIMFYATWRDEPLTKNTVWKFNKGIRLYDTSLIRNTGEYEVTSDYEAEHSERKWMAMHEIKCSFCDNNRVLKSETYSMNQIFLSSNDPVKFYYRPTIFDERESRNINNIQIVYTMKFMNVNDKVQFVKTASLSLTGNMGKYFAKSTNLSYGDLAPFKVYNKVVESKQDIGRGDTGIQKTKFIKTFYNSTDVVVDDDGTAYGTYEYTLKMSSAPKNYKFVFKKLTPEGKYSYMDLTDGYYKLMFKDSGKNTVTIEPTYSSNMNLFLGELEFTMSSGNISKLEEVEETQRKMSIVAYNEDGSVSSMFDFMYTI